RPSVHRALGGIRARGRSTEFHAVAARKEENVMMMQHVFGAIEALGPWTAHIQAMNRALSDNNPGESVRSWRQAYSAALSHPGWLGLLTVAAASLRLGVFPGLARGAVARARETYWIAFFRARQQHSLTGILHAAEAFSTLGDRPTVEQCL